MTETRTWRQVFFADRKGSLERKAPDTVFLLLVLLLLLCGTVMSFSASSVYGEQFYGDSTYFLRRYILFAVLSIGATVPIVLFAKPAFFRAFAVFLYAASVFLLVLVLIIGS